jgi:pyruvate carboxylase
MPIQSPETDKISHAKKRAFLHAFSRCGNVSKSAKRAHVDRRTHYDWLESDPDYAAAYSKAAEEAADAIQDALTDMAFEGNVTAAIFLLKGLKPKQFRDRVEQTNLIDVDPSTWTERQKDTLAEHMLRKVTDGDPERMRYLRRQAELQAGVVVVDVESEPPDSLLG